MKRYVNRENLIVVAALSLAVWTGYMIADEERELRDELRENNATQSKMYSKVEETLRLVRDELVPAAKADSGKPKADASASTGKTEPPVR